MPKEGGFVIEQTFVEPELYVGTTYPTVSVNFSRTKLLEMHEGTGDGFVRYLREIYQVENPDVNLQKINYLII